jgi:hypothetical protein
MFYRKYKIIKIFSIETYAEALSKGRFSKIRIRNGELRNVFFFSLHFVLCFVVQGCGGGEVSGGGTHYM